MTTETITARIADETQAIDVEIPKARTVVLLERMTQEIHRRGLGDDIIGVSLSGLLAPYVHISFEAMRRAFPNRFPEREVRPGGSVAYYIRGEMFDWLATESRTVPT